MTDLEQALRAVPLKCEECDYIRSGDYVAPCRVGGIYGHKFRPDYPALAAVVQELAEADFSAIIIACRRAAGALADAGTVPTGNLERGIRLLTTERDALHAALAEQAREIKELRELLETDVSGLTTEGDAPLD